MILVLCFSLDYFCKAGYPFLRLDQNEMKTLVLEKRKI